MRGRVLLVRSACSTANYLRRLLHAMSSDTPFFPPFAIAHSPALRRVLQEPLSSAAGLLLAVPVGQEETPKTSLLRTLLTIIVSEAEEHGRAMGGLVFVLQKSSGDHALSVSKVAQVCSCCIPAADEFVAAGCLYKNGLLRKTVMFRGEVTVAVPSLTVVIYDLLRKHMHAGSADMAIFTNSLPRDILISSSSSSTLVMNDRIAMAMARSHVKICRKCGGAADSLCARCKLVRYCSKACQRADYPDHKSMCHAVEDGTD